MPLTAWQVGMYGFMAIAEFLIFRGGFGTSMSTDTRVLVHDAGLDDLRVCDLLLGQLASAAYRIGGGDVGLTSMLLLLEHA